MAIITKRLAAVVSLCVLMLVLLQPFAQNGPDDPDAAPGYVKSVFDHGQVDSINLYTFSSGRCRARTDSMWASPHRNGR